MSKTALALSVTLGAVLGKSYFSTFGGAKKQTAQLGAALQKMGKESRGLDALKKGEVSIGKLAAEMDKAKKKVALLGRELSATAKPTKKLSREFEMAKKRSVALREKHRSQKEGLQSLREELKGAGHDTRRLGSAQAVLSSRIEKTTKRLEKQRSTLKKIEAGKRKLGAMKGKALAVAGSAYAAGSLIGNAASFELANVRLKTVINAKDTAKSLALAKKHALSFARNNLATETEIIDIQYALNSAGLDAEAARLGSSIVSKVATITSGSAESVGEIIGGIYNNFGDSLVGNTEEKLKRIGDLLTKTQFKFQIRDFAQLGEGFKEGAKSAIKYNVPLDQMATIIGQLNSSMVDGSKAGTASNAILNNMSKAADRFGFSIVRSVDGQMDMIATIKALNVALSNYDDIDERANEIQKAFGSEGSAIALLIKDIDKLEKSYKDVQETSKGLVDSSYADFLKSTSGQTTTFTNNVRILGTVFAGTLLPAVNAVLTPLASAFKWAGRMIEEYPVVGKVIGGVAVGFMALGTALAAVTAVKIGLAVASLGLSSSLGFLSVVAGAMGAVFSVIFSPIGLIVGAIVAVGSATYALYKNFDAVAAGAKRAFGGIKKTIGEVFNWLAEKSKFLFQFTPLGALIKGVGFISKLAGGAVGDQVKRSGVRREEQKASDVVKKSQVNESIKQVNQARSYQTTQHTSIQAPITIHADGANAQEIALAVSDQLDQREQESNRRQRAALYD